MQNKLFKKKTFFQYFRNVKTYLRLYGSGDDICWPHT